MWKIAKFLSLRECERFMEDMPLLLQKATRQVHTEFHKELQNPFREEAN